MEYLDLISKETAVTSSKLRETADELEPLEQEQEQILEEIKMSWLKNTKLDNESDIVKDFASHFSLNLSDAKKSFDNFPKQYIIDGKEIPEVVKSLRKYRRTLKGDNKERLTKSIENLIDAYSLHLDDCIKSIYWLSKYEYPLKQMTFNEMDLKKIHSVKNYNERLELVDILCKYWEADLDLKTTTYSKEYSTLNKSMTVAKKEFRKFIKGITTQSIRKNISDQVNDFILKSVCERPGISARQIYENMDNKLYRRSSPQIISKMVDRLGITNVEGAYYKLSDDIKKDLYAYTASFIDSDGYITIDKNYNPRVGLVATGDRGKAFMIQIQKELGIGKLHLDQKSPQGTRPVNRLNFYSQGDVHELLTKCRPHFRMKGKNADLLLELVRMKKSYKKADWYKQRCEEIFKLMKYENHKDHVGYDFTKYGIDFETVAKLHDNCKMGTMDELESISTPIIKQQERTFVIESYSREDEPLKDIELNTFLTAEELGINEDATQEEIEDILLDWMGDNVGWISGYIWYEITADGQKRNWLNPTTGYDVV